ncbi:class I SAM-dependent DNA methyltransferase [Aureliella helgolandensis]|uniref:Mg-protoporphyrin IX methyl transferase n=1 Tax=Aureliella helgolandensis TaxID=2527968 RepID=A0A518FZM4_9BACT|nr:class I SAM-dependent methyltransferase [Aureliella helgolandensis]QDV21740.1 Mg-protoporphyrin IX methyl transferase [Aureliella helgolandensis]
MRTPQKPSWQLPTGVSRGTWDYLQSPQIAQQYDAYFSDSALMQLDLQVLQQYLPPVTPPHAPTVADFGCGTGRVALQLLPLGYRLLNIDLSQAMLREVEAKIPVSYQHMAQSMQANLVDVGRVVPPESIDMGVCLFSSLGMIRGRKHRQQFLKGAFDSLAPSGSLLVHVHNRYHSLLDPGGSSWLLKSWWSSVRKRESEFGDRVYAYRGLPAMFLHIYSKRELLKDLRIAGFQRTTLLPISPAGDKLLPRSPLVLGVRTGGFFAVAYRSASVVSQQSVVFQQ